MGLRPHQVTRGRWRSPERIKTLGWKLADKIAKSLGATPLSPSKRSDLFTAYASADFDDRVAETNTTIYLRWDGEPVRSKMIGNYAMGMGKLQLFEHPSSPGLFVEFTSVDHNDEKTSECGLVHYTFYVACRPYRARAACRGARRGGKDPDVAAAILRERLRAGNKDPLLVGRLARTEIAAGKEEGKTRQLSDSHAASSGHDRHRRPGLFGARQAATGAGQALHRRGTHRRRRFGRQDTLARRTPAAQSVRRGGARLDRLRRRGGAAAGQRYRGGDLDAVTALVAARFSYTALSQIGRICGAAIEYGREGIRFFDDDELLLRQRWRTTSPSSAYTVTRLGHAKSRNHVLRYVSAPGWHWSEGSVCEDEVEDFALLTAADGRDRRCRPRSMKPRT